jgi:hypothetical protein
MGHERGRFTDKSVAVLTEFCTTIVCLAFLDSYLSGSALTQMRSSEGRPDIRKDFPFMSLSRTFQELFILLLGGHLLSPTYGHLFFPHPLCPLAGMKKRRDMCIQVLIRYPGLKSDSWVGDFEVAIRVLNLISYHPELG